ncbi:strigolactone esterase D14-like [Iris pallida]|uniref:Strigolactone esterase D14-like n=1 Tax=Iris pallida TaxID=29817 RepID=A0AAX6F3U8_IRIPA|nr:strigolactone esterase D14-like [Iris pallida]
MNTRIVGCGEVTMVLSHGYGGSQSVWDDVVPHLSQRYRVLLFDWCFSSAVDPSSLPDAGSDPSRYSSLGGLADDLVSLLDEMELGRVVFVGHSMAGMVGCLASVRRPDLFAYLVLIGASPRYYNSEDYEGGFERKEVEGMVSSIESDFLTWAKSFAALAVGADDPESVEKFGRSLAGMRPEAAVPLARTLFFGDLRDVVEKVEVPCTIIQGANDVVVPVSVAHYMKSRMKGKARVEIMDADGHFPQLTSPRMLLNIIDSHLMPLIIA